MPPTGDKFPVRAVVKDVTSEKKKKDQREATLLALKMEEGATS